LDIVISAILLGSLTCHDMRFSFASNQRHIKVELSRYYTRCRVLKIFFIELTKIFCHHEPFRVICPLQHFSIQKLFLDISEFATELMLLKSF